MKVEILQKQIEVGDAIQLKNEPTYIGVCTKISIPKTPYGIKQNIRFPFLDNNNYPSGETIDKWQAIKIIRS